MRWLILLSPFLLGACDISGGCEDKVLDAKPDLEGGLIAYRFVRDCGATTDYVTHVAIGRQGESRENAESVFVATAGSDTDTDGDAVWIDMVWTRPHQLSVAYAQKARVFKKLPNALGAMITYRATSRSFMPPPPIKPDTGAGSLSR